MIKSGFFSAKAFADRGGSVYTTKNGKDVVVTSVNAPTLHPDCVEIPNFEGAEFAERWEYPNAEVKDRVETERKEGWEWDRPERMTKD